MTWTRHERATLVEVLTEVGPDVPTLCEGWLSRHIAAHVVLREHSPVVGIGLALRPLGPVADRAVDRLAATVRDDADWAALVARVGRRPPRWHPISWAERVINLVELFVHTEDVRRGAGPVPPLGLDPAHEQALWEQLGRTARLAYRRVPTGIVLVTPDGPRRVVRDARRGRHGTVVVRGDVGELVLHALGRGAAADVTLQGDPEDVAAVRRVLPGG